MNILILGASRGIGLEFVRQYRADSENVTATARDAAGLRALRDLGATALTLDVAEPASIEGLTPQLDGKNIDLALYVAGVSVRGDASQPPAQADFDRAMRTNVLGAMQLIPRVAPRVEAAGGRFVFISSRMGRIAEVESSHSWVYRVSKAALNMAVAAAQLNYPKAIFVAMHPGWVQTDMGGVGAPLTVQDSVASMRRAIANLKPADAGAFVNHDGHRFDGW